MDPLLFYDLWPYVLSIYFGPIITFSFSLTAWKRYFTTSVQGPTVASINVEASSLRALAKFMPERSKNRGIISPVRSETVRTQACTITFADQRQQAPIKGTITLELQPSWTSSTVARLHNPHLRIGLIAVKQAQ